MIISCTCGKKLTGELVQVQLDDYDKEMDWPSGANEATHSMRSDLAEHIAVKSGIFFAIPEWMGDFERLALTNSGDTEERNSPSRPQGIVVGQSSVLSGIIPEWIEWKAFEETGIRASGCCGWADLELECECGNVLGLVEIDCWQYRDSVTFYAENIVQGDE